MAGRIFVAASVVLCFVWPASASIFVTDLTSGANPLPIPGNQAWGGQLGDDFSTTQSISISKIGVFDDDGNGTTTDLVWQIFNVQTGSLIHEETVAASGARTPGSTVEDNYVWLDLATSIVLSAGQTYSAVAYGFNDANKNFNTNLNLATLDVEFSTDGLSAAGGRYSNPGFTSSVLPSIGAGNTASAQAYNFGAATFEYAVVPEAASVAVWSLLALTVSAGLWLRRRMGRA